MPNIREYNAPEGLGLRPNETGVDAVAAAARRTGAIFNQVGSETAAVGNQFGRDLAESIRAIGDVAVKYEDHAQISHGTAAGMALAADLDQQWNKIAATADPNDRSVRGRFLERTVEPALEKFVGNFSTENSQRFADQFTANLRNHLWTKTAADMSTNGARAALSNASTTINSLGAMVRADPSSLGFAMTTLDDMAKNIATTSPTLDATKSAMVQDELLNTGKKALTHAYLISVADKNPGAIPGIIESQKFAKYLTTDDTTTILNYAKTVGKVNDSAVKHAREEQEYQAKQDFDRKATELELATVPQNPTDRPTLPANYWKQVLDLGKMPGADPSRVRALLHTGDALAARLNQPEPAAANSARNAVDIMNRMRATDGKAIDGEQAANEAYGRGQLTSGDRNTIIREWRDSKTSDGETLARTKAAFFDAVEPKINSPLMTIGDDDAKLRFYRYQSDVNRMVDEYRRQGKNPRDLFDPLKPDFVGSDAFLNQPQYRTSMQQGLPAAASRPRASVNLSDQKILGVQVIDAPIPKREAGESLDAWMKRTGRGIPAAPSSGPTAPVSR